MWLKVTALPGGWQVIPSVKKEEAIRIYVEAQVDHIPFRFCPVS